jgi:hypothetical protein
MIRFRLWMFASVILSVPCVGTLAPPIAAQVTNEPKWSPTGQLVEPSTTPVGRNLEQEPPAKVGARFEGATKTSADLPSRDAIKTCLLGSGPAECLDKLFREALKTHSTGEALRLIQRLEAEDAELRRDCHPVVHAIGRETFRLKNNIHESFAACDQTCHSGCYHGSVERFLRGEEIYAMTDKHPSQAELKQKAAAACDPALPMRLRFQCLHGLGHALMFFSRYELAQSLGACDALADDWSRNSCYGGVFMENVVNATGEKINFSATDYHAPCNGLDAQYRRECYMMQTSRMVEMGLSPIAIFAQCAKAGAYRAPCVQSAGRDLSNFARVGDAREAAQTCELASGDDRIACLRGVVYALIDNTWDGRYALPFCTALSEAGDREGCLREGVTYLRTVFDKPPAEVAGECSRYAAAAPSCVEAAAR